MHTRWLVIAISLALAAAGCAHRMRHCHHCGSAHDDDATMPDRGKVQLIVFEQPHDNPAYSNGYEPLDPAACQQRAAANAPMAHELSVERHLAEAGCLPSLHPAKRLQSQVLSNAIVEAQNRAAGEALRKYFDLAEAEAKFDVATRAIDELTGARDAVNDLSRRGLEIPANAREFEAQLIDMQSKRAALETSIVADNRELHILLSSNSCNVERRFWPTYPLQLPAEAIDADGEAALGVCSRPDVKTACLLAAEYGPCTRSVIDKYLTSMHPLSGISTPGASSPVFGLLLMPVRSRDTAMRRHQLNDHCQRQRQRAAQEIRGAAELYQGALVQVEQARRLQALRTDRIHVVEEQQRLDQATMADVTQARLSALEAESRTIEAVATALRAYTRLGETKGVLACETLFVMSPAEPVEAIPSINELPNREPGATDDDAPPAPPQRRLQGPKLIEQSSVEAVPEIAVPAADDAPAPQVQTSRREFYGNHLLR